MGASESSLTRLHLDHGTHESLTAYLCSLCLYLGGCMLASILELLFPSHRIFVTVVVTCLGTNG